MHEDLLEEGRNHQPEPRCPPDGRVHSRLAAPEEAWPWSISLQPSSHPAGMSNLLEQDFTALEPERKWITGITEIATLEGKLFLCGARPIQQAGDRLVDASSSGSTNPFQPFRGNGVESGHLFILHNVRKRIWSISYAIEGAYISQNSKNKNHINKEAQL
ncbi:TPA: hypothetical protein SL418_001577 [Pseudomonas aeruginosa]|nr:hypothetical protein [Pseudomonas aeruginosa]